MWSKSFADNFGDKSFTYRGKEIPVKSLGLSSDYLGHFCRDVFYDRSGSLDGITYKEIRLVRSVGDKKARAIAEALVAQGVEITDIPDEETGVRLIEVTGHLVECNHCTALLTTNTCVDGRLYTFCPMCGRKFKW